MYPDAQGSPIVERIYEGSRVITASPQRTFDALLDERALRVWFAEHVVIEPRVGGAYRFWGRHTPCSEATNAHQVITALEPLTRLAFSWDWNGGPTDVDLRVSCEAATTRVTVLHDFTRGGAVQSPRERSWLAHDFWTVSLINLDSFLRTGAPTLLPRYPEPRPEVELSIEIDTDIDTLWSSLTDADKIRRWLGVLDPRLDLRPRGQFSFGWTVDGQARGPQSIVAIDAPHRLVIEWLAENGETRRVEWLLERLARARTRLRVLQMDPLRNLQCHREIAGWAKFLVALEARARQSPTDLA